jgi:hypothetical protein
MEKINKYLIITAALIIGLLLFKDCEPKESSESGPKIKIDTIYKIKTLTTKYTDTIIKLKYKDRYLPFQQIKNEIEETLDTGYVYLKYNDYHFKYDTITTHKYGEQKLSINGWGYINKIEVENTYKDTTTIITKEITKYKPSKGLFISPQYNRPFNNESSLKPSYNVNLDYINNNWLIGGSIGVQNDIPMYGIRIGFKIK